MYRSCIALVLLFAAVVTVRAWDTLTVNVQDARYPVFYTFTPIWWLQDNEVIQSCTAEFPDGSVMACTPTSAHQIKIESRLTANVGTITVNVNTGTIYIAIVVGGAGAGLPEGAFCYHGTPNGAVCDCDVGWTGGGCGQLGDLITVPLTGTQFKPNNPYMPDAPPDEDFRPMYWLQDSEVITSCWITGIPNPPACRPLDQQWIDIGVFEAPGVATLNLQVNDGFWDVTLLILDGSDELTEPCVHGRAVGGVKCRCQTDWSGYACQSAICNPPCDSIDGGTCIYPGQCRCKQYYGGEYCNEPICTVDCHHGSCHST